MFQNTLNRFIGSITSWLFGYYSPEIAAANTAKVLNEEAREIITFYMQNLSFMVAIILGALGIYSFFKRRLKTEKDDN